MNNPKGKYNIFIAKYSKIKYIIRSYLFKQIVHNKFKHVDVSVSEGVSVQHCFFWLLLMVESTYPFRKFLFYYIDSDP